MKLDINNTKLFTRNIIKHEFPHFIDKADNYQNTIRAWQNNIIKLLPDYKKNLTSTIGKTEEEKQLYLLNYIKLLSVYYLADYLCKKISVFFESALTDPVKISEKLKDIEGIVFEFIDKFNQQIDLLNDDVTGFIRMHEIIGSFNSSNNENINELYGNIQDFPVIDKITYNSIIEVILSKGMNNKGLRKKFVECDVPTTNTICGLKDMEW